ncbi:hypothetical protein BB559_003504 [Furculomyces boomerangus]|uniref:Tyrosinase copper-binding domain-containing protein n=2 Tax=Harpellales TaxID=61421 RepID=A0A2T9YL16_9FUNG|nr:hypothetical protein BB559_005305 [Furculomyces boomerangus]PVU91098.1 hypothetical protein BB559_004301 [Furculomyces boomerangus]PVU93018.1 hypothetical protein BB559_003504 [Furculomyces boomerangus]PVZ98932.1 hypothetical protein BB558_005062 [Smittium angustum]
MKGLYKLFSIAFIASSSILTSAQNLPRCARITVRKEIRNTSPAEWAMIKSVLTQMHRDGEYSKFAKIHTEQFAYVHGGPIFMPFHRRLTVDLENVGKRYNPDFFIPYWDAARDFRDPVSSIVYTPNYLGGNGDPNNNNCITNGLQSGWTMPYQQPHCLARIFNGPNGSIKSWYSPETMTSLLQTSLAFDKFRSNVEFTLHGAVHLGFGGDMTQMWSPNDFGFFLHHSNIDRLWWKWQNGASGNLMQYGGQNPKKTGNAQLSDIIDGYPEKIGDMMRLGYGNLCYTYDDSTAVRSTTSSQQDSSVVSSNSTRALNTANSSDNDDGKTFNAGLRTLSVSTLNRFFPAFSKGNDNPNLFETSGLKLGKITKFTTESRKPERRARKRGYGQCDYRRLPLPEIPPDHFIRMHNYSRTEVVTTVNQFRALVVALNNEGYQSPY